MSQPHERQVGFAAQVETVLAQLTDQEALHARNLVGILNDIGINSGGLSIEYTPAIDHQSPCIRLIGGANNPTGSRDAALGILKTSMPETVFRSYDAFHTDIEVVGQTGRAGYTQSEDGASIEFAIDTGGKPTNIYLGFRPHSQ